MSLAIMTAVSPSAVEYTGNLRPAYLLTEEMNPVDTEAGDHLTSEA